MTSIRVETPGADEIERWFQRHISTLTGLSPDAVSADADFDSFGIDSVQGVDMITALETHLGLVEDLPIDLIFEADSLAHAAHGVADVLAGRGAQS